MKRLWGSSCLGKVEKVVSSNSDQAVADADAAVFLGCCDRQLRVRVDLWARSRVCSPRTVTPSA